MELERADEPHAAHDAGKVRRLATWSIALNLRKLLDRGERVLDVGTGGGVPGVLLAILRPDLRVSLCESTQKKAKAVEAIVGQMGLTVPVYACRAEEVLQVTTFDTLVARALAPLTRCSSGCGRTRTHSTVCSSSRALPGSKNATSRHKAGCTAWRFAGRPYTKLPGQTPKA